MVFGSTDPPTEICGTSVLAADTKKRAAYRQPVASILQLRKTIQSLSS
jgi:hypothetical protein